MQKKRNGWVIYVIKNIFHGKNTTSLAGKKHEFQSRSHRIESYHPDQTQFMAVLAVWLKPMPVKHDDIGSTPIDRPKFRRKSL